MLKLLMKYSGTAAKVRAMYGKRLRRADFEQLMGMDTVADAATFLKQTAGWGATLASIEPSNGDYVALERALEAATSNEFVRLYKFMSHEDHPLMRSVIERAEQSELLDFMLMWQAGTAAQYRCRMPEYFRTHSPIDFAQFRMITDFEQFWSAISGSVYYPALAGLPRERGQPPDYTVAKTVMDTRYYSNIFKIIDKRYSGDTAMKLGDGFGAEVDLLNITAIIRVKRFFPAMSDSVADYLIPLRRRLKTPLLRRMMDAPDSQAALEVAKTSAYRKLFERNDFEMVDDYAAKHLYEFNRKLLMSPTPSMYTPVAYLNLKQTELLNIKKIIECIRYGISPAESGIYLAGYDRKGDLA